jgi:flagellar basal body-associated protein FliL
MKDIQKVVDAAFAYGYAARYSDEWGTREDEAEKAHTALQAVVKEFNAPEVTPADVDELVNLTNLLHFATPKSATMEQLKANQKALRDRLVAFIEQKLAAS